MFRSVPYKHETDWLKQWQKNLMRVAEVWMGEYKRYFYSSTRIYEIRRVSFTPEQKASLKRRLKLKDSLKCKPFQWYLDKVIPELPIPPHDAVQHGEVTNYRSQACWMVLDDGYLAITYACYEHKTIPENVFSLTKDGLLLYKDRCVKYMYPTPNLKVEKCPAKANLNDGVWSVRYLHEQDRWGLIQISIWIGSKVKLWCIGQVTSAVAPHQDIQMPQMMDCNEKDTFSIWTFTYRFDFEG